MSSLRIGHIVGLLVGFTLWGATLSRANNSYDNPPLSRFQYTQLHMGVAVRLVVYAPDEPTAVRACTAAYARIAALEDIMSDYRPTSELMRLCAQAGGPPVRVSDDLFLVLRRAHDLARRSNGAFDVTVGPLVVLWRKARKIGALPDAAQLRRARELTGWRKMRLDEQARTVQLLVPGMRLDLGGIAKGYAGDCALAVLKEQGITRALFEAGGDIVVGDPPPGTDGWAVTLFDAKAKQRPFKLANSAISTSGDTEQFVEIDGKRYSHVVDPHTGLGLTNRIAVTIIAREGITSDSLSKAVGVLGSRKGVRATRSLTRSFPGASASVRFLNHQNTKPPRNRISWWLGALVVILAASR